MLLPPAFCQYIVYLCTPFRESEEHSICGVLCVVRGSARVSCVCSSPIYSLSVPIGLKLVIAYRSCRCVSGLCTILSHIDFSHFFSRDHRLLPMSHDIDCWYVHGILI